MGKLFYRINRLRRLIAVACLIPLLVVGLIFVLKGPAAFALIPIAIVPCVFHVLRYPNQWMETLALSVTLAVLLLLIGSIGPDVGLLGLGVRIVVLAAVGIALFMILNTAIVLAISIGSPRAITVRARRLSRLPVDELRQAVTLYPGRNDDKYECGAANEDGIFPITMKLQGEAPLVDPAEMSALDPEDEAERKDEVRAQLLELGLDPDGLDFDLEPDITGAFEAHLFGIVSHSDETAHDVIVVEEGGSETTATRMSFIPKRNGTLVSMEERSAPMPPGYALGFWLQDYGADYLTDEVDRAEGRVLRANRSSSQDSFLGDVARWFMSRGAQTPAE